MTVIRDMLIGVTLGMCVTVVLLALAVGIRWITGW